MKKILSALLLLSSLTACGQKGALYLPQDSQNPVQQPPSHQLSDDNNY